jgi:hypothetical protein
VIEITFEPGFVIPNSVVLTVIPHHFSSFEEMILKYPEVIE